MTLTLFNLSDEHSAPQHRSICSGEYLLPATPSMPHPICPTPTKKHSSVSAVGVAVAGRMDVATWVDSATTDGSSQPGRRKSRSRFTLVGISSPVASTPHTRHSPAILIEPGRRRRRSTVKRVGSNHHRLARKDARRV